LTPHRQRWRGTVQTRRAANQLLMAHSEVILNFTAFRCRDHGIGNAPPSYGLPIHQLTNFGAYSVRGIIHFETVCQRPSPNFRW